MRIVTKNKIGNFHVLEYKQEASVSPMNAMVEYYMGQMNIRRRQLVIDIDKNHSAVIQAGAMQWMAGNVQAASGVKGLGDLFNLSLQGNGIAALESNVPYEELVEVVLENDELRIDGNLAECWSSNLQFTVERTTNTLAAKAAAKGSNTAGK